MARFLFPKWANKVVPLGIVFGVGPLGTAVVAGVWYYGTNKHFEVGYTPEQPVPYSHKLHAGDMGIDCRYCHSTIEEGAFAAVPPAQTCMNCHSKVRTTSPALEPIRQSFATGKSVPWVQIHNLPDYVYFDHSVHLSSGVGCESCHGRVDQMVEVSQVKPLTMGWCLDCHRDSAHALRDPKDVTKMGMLEDSEKTGQPMPRSANARKPVPPTNCSGCHR